MGFLFDFLGNIAGYILWFFFDAVSNYSVAILLFALVVNLVMLPVTIKRQKNMARMSKLGAKLSELRKKYEKNPRKYNEEMTKLYEKEGVSPMSGCFSTMLLPLLIWGGGFSAVARPLDNTLHISAEKVTSVVTTLKDEGKIAPPYEQLQLVRHFDELKGELSEFSKEEFAAAEEYSNGFNFFGINLLGNPSGASFSEMLWVIPLLCLVSSALTVFLTQKISVSEQQAAGCAKFTPYVLVLFTTWMTYTMPAAVGLYWCINGLFGALQTLILSKFYNTYTINADAEAKRFALLEVQEEKVEKLK